MSREEKYGDRDLTYSLWHRKLPEDWLTQIDLDYIVWVEYRDETREPLALIEEARDIGQNKTTTVTAGLGQRANLPAYRLLWTPGKILEHNIICPKCNGTGEIATYDIVQFRTKLVYPLGGEEAILTPEQWHNFLKNLRTQYKWSSEFFSFKNPWGLKDADRKKTDMG